MLEHHKTALTHYSNHLFLSLSSCQFAMQLKVCAPKTQLWQGLECISSRSRADMWTSQCCYRMGLRHLWITTQSFHGLVDTCTQGHFYFTNYSLFSYHVSHYCLSPHLVTITSTECLCRCTDHVPMNSSKKHVFRFSTLTHYASQSFTDLSSTRSLSGITL